MDELQHRVDGLVKILIGATLIAFWGVVAYLVMR